MRLYRSPAPPWTDPGPRASSFWDLERQLSMVSFTDARHDPAFGIHFMTLMICGEARKIKWSYEGGLPVIISLGPRPTPSYSRPGSFILPLLFSAVTLSLRLDLKTYSEPLTIHPSLNRGHQGPAAIMHLTPHLLSILSLFAIANSAALPVGGHSRTLRSRAEDTSCTNNCTAQVKACVAGSINAIARLGW